MKRLLLGGLGSEPARGDAPARGGRPLGRGGAAEREGGPRAAAREKVRLAPKLSGSGASVYGAREYVRSVSVSRELRGGNGRLNGTPFQPNIHSFQRRGAVAAAAAHRRFLCARFFDLPARAWADRAMQPRAATRRRSRPIRSPPRPAVA